jgi:hypothetical protein
LWCDGSEVVFVNVVKACIQIEEIAKKCKTKNRRSSDFTLQSSGSSGTRAANRAHLDSTKFLFSSKYFSQAKVPEKYGSQEI